MKRALLVVAVLVSVLASTINALADSVSDPEDVGGKLDIVRVSAERGQGDTFRINTAEGWRCKYLKPSKKTKLAWKFDDSGNSQPEYAGKFVCRGGDLVFEMKSTDGQNQYEPLPTERPNKKSVIVTVPGGFFGNDLKVWALSKDAEAADCPDRCKDRAPNAGAVNAD